MLPSVYLCLLGSFAAGSALSHSHEGLAQSSMPSRSSSPAQSSQSRMTGANGEERANWVSPSSPQVLTIPNTLPYSPPFEVDAVETTTAATAESGVSGPAPRTESDLARAYGDLHRAFVDNISQKWNDRAIKSRRQQGVYNHRKESMQRALNSPPDDVQMIRRPHGFPGLIPHPFGLTNRQYLHQPSVIRIVPKDLRHRIPEPDPKVARGQTIFSPVRPKDAEEAAKLQAMAKMPLRQRVLQGHKDDVVLFIDHNRNLVRHPLGKTNQQYIDEQLDMTRRRQAEYRRRQRQPEGDWRISHGPRGMVLDEVYEGLNGRDSADAMAFKKAVIRANQTARQRRYRYRLKQRLQQKKAEHGLVQSQGGLTWEDPPAHSTPKEAQS